jgi:uncharacterized membrane protein
MSSSLLDYFILSILLIILDFPWLFVSSTFVGNMVEKIQGSPLQFNLWPSQIVYLAMAYLLTRTKTPSDAFLLGLCVYAVYDFTNLATLNNYSPYFAIADSLWGGILFASARYILNRFFT